MNSTTLQFNRWSYEPESSYLSFMSLALHEYFHLWNVKRLRPIELGPFDYENENHTELLWVMEGVTSYYDEYLMLRTGLINKHNYLDRLEGNINAAENRPGNEIQSLAHSSFYAWIKSYRPNENSMNTSVSYYGKGSVVAALLDLEIRKSTKGEKSLDDLMKYLYNLYYKEKQRGMTSAEFKLGAEHISGEIMDEFFYKNVYGTGRINYSKYFKDFGISILDVNTTELKAFLGLNVSEKNGKLVVNNVHRESPAYFAGFSANDEIIAINDNRVNSKVFRELISFENPGAEITVLLSRMGLLMEKKVKLSRDKSVDYVLMENQTEELNLLKNGWLGTE